MTFRSPRTPHLPYQRGFSLAELMVAIAVSLILLAGVIQIFVSNKQAYRIQEGFSVLNENSRYALRKIGYSLRMADNWGGADPATNVVRDSGLPTVTGDCAANWSTTIEGLRGIEGAATSPLATCIANADYVPNSDIIVTRYTAAGPVTGTLTASALYLRTTPGSGAQIFEGADESASLGRYTGNRNNSQALASTFVHPYLVEAYFIRPCASRGANGVCDANDDGGSPIPTLARLVLDGTTLVQEDVVSGVEQMQAIYGVDTDADTVADRYFTASAVPAGNWPNVVSVRLTLLLRNTTRDATADDRGTTYPMAGRNHSVAAADASYRRKLVDRVIQIRNQVRSQ